MLESSDHVFDQATVDAVEKFEYAPLARERHGVRHVIRYVLEADSDAAEP